MKWIRIRLKTTTEAVDFISSLFDELGLEGIQIEDNIPLSEEEKQAMYIDILPELPEDDGIAYVSSYVEDGTDIDGLAEGIKAGLEELAMFTNIGEGTLEISETDDKDWIDNWKAYFKSFYAAEGIYVKPTWEKLEENHDKDIVIEIDPGTAFGTGAHETTKLAICGIQPYITPETTLLDVGCGSGILSIIALKLGAKSAMGIDIDPIAVDVTKENMEVNGLSDADFEVYAGNILEDKEVQDKAGYEKYDIVVANILADVIIPLAAEAGKYLKKGGLFISSGIINTMKDEVEKAILSNGFTIQKVNTMKDWVSFVACKE